MYLERIHISWFILLWWETSSHRMVLVGKSGARFFLSAKQGGDASGKQLIWFEMNQNVPKLEICISQNLELT